jgi:hypothetical protein
MKSNGWEIDPLRTDFTHADGPSVVGRKLRVIKIPIFVLETHWEETAGDLLGDDTEPDWRDCAQALADCSITHYLPGETTLNTARATYLLKHKAVDAILHVIPMFCCPGMVTASLFKKIAGDFGVPSGDIFFDGTGDPNRVLMPHLHYLTAWKKEQQS